MKKLALLALFATVSALSFGQAATANTSAAVLLTVADYVAIDFTDVAGDFAIAINDGGQTASYTSSNTKVLRVRSNKGFTVACPDDVQAPLTFSAVFTAFTGAAGTESKNVQAKVVGASLTTAPNTYNATLTFTVTQN